LGGGAQSCKEVVQDAAPLLLFFGQIFVDKFLVFRNKIFVKIEFDRKYGKKDRKSEGPCPVSLIDKE